MKLPIPDDWDGKSWRCVQIEWPDSELWRGILRGLLWSMARGRTWNEDTGSLLDVQAVGLDIWARSGSLPRCEGADDGEDDTDERDGEGPNIYICAEGDADEESEVGAYITDLKIEDGKLVAYYGHCCRVVIGDFTTLPGDLPGPTPEDYFPDDFEPPAGQGTWACLKATAIVKSFEDVLTALIAGMDMSPFDAISYLGEQVPYLDLKNADKSRLYFLAQLFERTIPLDEIEWDSEKTELAKCQLAVELNNTSSAMTADEFETAFRIIGNQAGTWRQIYNELARNIPKSGYRAAIAAGVFAAEANCDCPEENPEPVYGGSVRFDGTYTPNPSQMEGRTYTETITPGSVDGQIAYNNVGWPDGTITFGLDADTPVSSITFRVSGLNPPTLNWLEVPASHGPDTWNVPSIIPAPQGWQGARVNGASYVDYTISFASPVTPESVAFGGHNYPASPSGGQGLTQYTLTIIKINGQAV